MTKAFQVTAYDDDGEILAWCNQPTRELAERQVETYLKQGAPDAAIEEVTEIPQDGGTDAIR